MAHEAGIYNDSSLCELVIADHERIFSVNVRGTVLVTKAVLRYI